MTSARSTSDGGHSSPRYKLTDNRPTQLMKGKLSCGQEGLLDACWCGPTHLACVSADMTVRVTDICDEESCAEIRSPRLDLRD